MGVLIEEHHRFRIFLTSRQETGLSLQFSKGIGIEMIDAATPANSEEATILVRHFHQIGKKVPPTRLRHGTQVTGIAESPELLGIVPAQEVWECLEEILESFQVVVLDMSMSTRSRLTREPHTILLTYCTPRLVGTYSITWHTIHASLSVELARQ